MKQALTVSVVTTVFLIACRDDAPTPNYDAFAEIFDRATAGDAESIPGPDPYLEGEERLVFVPYYDSEGFSDTISPGVAGIDSFIFTTEFGDQPTFDQDESTNRIEGSSAQLFTFTGQGGFWGTGYFSENRPLNLTGFETLVIGLQGGGDPSSAEVEISMGSGPPGDDRVLASVNASDYGYLNNTEWQLLLIPLQDFIDRGVDPFGITVPLQLVNTTTFQGDTLLVDNVYFDEAPIAAILEDLPEAAPANDQ
ncbi:MAG: hypothetical protein AAFZ38_01800 [Myxococcota bacterium]